MAWTISQDSAYSGKIVNYFYRSDEGDDGVLGGLPIVFEWRVIEQSGMESTISYTFRLNSSGDDYFSGFSYGSYAIINGNSIYSPRTDNPIYPYETLASGRYVLKRDSTTNIGTFRVRFFLEGTYYMPNDLGPAFQIHYTSDPIDYTWSIPSTTVAGSGAVISAVSDFTDETSPVVTYSYDRGTKVEEATVQMGISFGNGSTMDIPYRNVDPTATSYTFNFTQSELDTLYTLLNDGPTASVRFYVKTVELINGEYIPIISYFAKTFNFVNYKPLIKPTLTDINDTTYALTGNRNHLVRYMSKVAYDMNVELRKGALDIIGCYIQNGGRIEEGFTSGTFENPTTNIFYFSATDDRGYTGTTSKSLSLFDGEFIDYIKLSSSLKSTPISGEGNVSITITGKYFNANFGVAQNKLDMQYAIYKKGTTPTWSAVQTITPVMIDNETYTYTFSDSGLDYTAQYIVAVKVNDLLMSSESSISVVAKPVFYWNNDEFIFNVPVTFKEGLEFDLYEEGTATGYYMNANGSYASGDYTWYYRKWNDGLLECWCTVPISTTVNTAWGSLYTASALYKTDLSYPIQPVGAPMVMVTLGAGNTKGMLMVDNSYAADNISTGRYNIVSATSVSSSATFRINYYVKGRWK